MSSDKNLRPLGKEGKGASISLCQVLGEEDINSAISIIGGD